MKEYKLDLSNPDYMSRTKKEKGPLDALTFVITGTLSKPREEFESLIEQNGGRATGSVSKKTDYVLAGIEPGKNKARQSKRT